MTELWDVVKLARAQTEEGRVVFWKRGPYGMSGNYQSKPRWHQLVRIDRAEEPNKWHYRWTAVCGYQHVFNGLLGEKPDLRVEVKTKGLRCTKCDAATVHANGSHDA